jgi:hypothetical protein
VGNGPYFPKETKRLVVDKALMDTYNGVIMTTMNNQTPSTPGSLGPIPTMLLTPMDWALETQRLAAEYAGLPEGKEFLVTSRRFLALGAKIKDLEGKVSQLETLLENAEESRRR